MMGTAEIILASIQLARLALELVEKYQRGELTDEELQAKWFEMQGRLSVVSAKIRGGPPPGTKAGSGID